MWIACLDLESVLAPELWPLLADAYGVDELRLTTRQVGDKVLLNNTRLAALRKHKIGVKKIERVMAKVQPLAGAAEFLQWLNKRMPFIIVSDCYRPLAMGVLKKLGVHAILAHEWQVRGGFVSALPLRLTGDTKKPVVAALKGVGYQVLAVGDSLNDLGMLTTADAASWYQPSPRALAEAPKLQVSKSYAQLKKYITKVTKL